MAAFYEIFPYKEIKDKERRSRNGQFWSKERDKRLTKEERQKRKDRVVGEPVVAQCQGHTFMHE